jgi:beta-glucosidase
VSNVLSPSGDVIYRDATRPVVERVADLLARMTLAEKVGQLGSAWVFELATVATTELRPEAIELMRDGLGQVTRVSGASNAGSVDAARMANAIQRFLVEHTRLGIPAVVHEEVSAGLMARDATEFPQPIGLASTWSPAAVTAMADVVRREARALGAHQGLSPVLDVCRDPRWGRTEETFGEDPHLVAEMGIAFVRGLQGPTLTEGVVATGKHFVGYGASQGGLNWAPAFIPPRELREVYLHPFEAAVRHAGMRSVMNAYQELDGVPCAGSAALLTGILRGEWGFGGCVVADYFAVRQLEDYHHVAADAGEAAAIAVGSGIDVELPSTDCYGAALVAVVEQGHLALDVVDRAVARVLMTKFELGLFERPYVDDTPSAVAAIVGTASAADLAADLARHSLVLLRNDGTLPLDPTALRRVAVIGPNADDARNLHGDYSFAAHVESLRETRTSDNVFNVPVPDDLDLDLDEIARPEPTVLTALTGALPGVDVRSATGCDVAGSSTDGFAAAVTLAAQSDVAIVVVGDKAGLTDDSTTGEARDRSSLDLPGVQEQLVAAVAATGTPVVLVHVGGRPAGSVTTHESAAAVLEAWIPGPSGASAIADTLVGATNPGGKLPLSFPRSAGHVPVYYRQKRSGGRSHWKGDYADAPVAPLYAFGHGLSYTTFRIDAGAPSPSVVRPGESVTLAVDVANTGEREGDEVVQLYVRDPRARITRPVLELKAFARVRVPVGEARRVEFSVPVGQLGYHDQLDGDHRVRYVVEAGEIEVFVGSASDRLTSAGSFHVDTGGTSVVEIDKAFLSDVMIHVNEGDRDE